MTILQHAGDYKQWEQEIVHLLYAKDDPLILKNKLYKQGYTPAVLTETIWGWNIKLVNGGNYLLPLIAHIIDKQKVIEYGIKWANEDPKNRHFYEVVNGI